MTKRRDEMLDHEFDGIREYDNPPPPWIMWILYGSLAFAVVYWMVFHTFRVAAFPTAEYDHEMARAAEMQLARMSSSELTDDALALMSTIPNHVAEGRQIYDQFCVACHMPDGQGSVGPNLTDAYWLHGGRPLQILKTVTDGVPDKGMVAWGAQLGPSRVQKVTAYLLTIKGKNVPGKAPQGTMETESPPAQAVPAEPGVPPAEAPTATPAAAHS